MTHAATSTFGVRVYTRPSSEGEGDAAVHDWQGILSEEPVLGKRQRAGNTGRTQSEKWSGEQLLEQPIYGSQRTAVARLVVQFFNASGQHVSVEHAKPLAWDLVRPGGVAAFWCASPELGEISEVRVFRGGSQRWWPVERVVVEHLVRVKYTIEVHTVDVAPGSFTILLDGEKGTTATRANVQREFPHHGATGRSRSPFVRGQEQVFTFELEEPDLGRLTQLRIAHRAQDPAEEPDWMLENVSVYRDGSTTPTVFPSGVRRSLDAGELLPESLGEAPASELTWNFPIESGVAGVPFEGWTVFEKSGDAIVEPEPEPEPRVSSFAARSPPVELKPIKPEDLQLALRPDTTVPVPAIKVDSVMAMGLRKTFEQIDENGDGQLSRAEIILRIRKDEDLGEMLGMTGGKVTEAQRVHFEEMFQEIDVESDDSVSADEFVHFWMQRMAGARAAAAQAQAPAAPEARPFSSSQPGPTAALSVPMWQVKLVVLCDLARELTTLNQHEPAAAIAYRILDLDGLLLPAPGMAKVFSSPELLVLVASLAKEFATNGKYEPASVLAQRVLKLDAGNTAASGVVRFVRDQAQDWSTSSGQHLPGVRVGREHADRGAYAIQTPARALHGPRPRQPASLNPRPGAEKVRPKTGRTIYVLPGKLSSSAGTPRDKAPSLTARAPTGRPVPTDTELGGITPAGLRSTQLARQYDMVPISVLLRESSSPKHTTSWVVMDEAAIPMGQEKAQVMLLEAYAVKAKAAAVHKEAEQLRREAEDDKRRIKLLERVVEKAKTAKQSGGRIQTAFGASVLGGMKAGIDLAAGDVPDSAPSSLWGKAEEFARLLDIMNQEDSPYLKPEDDGWVLPPACALMLEQLIDEAEADEAMADMDAATEDSGRRPGSPVKRARVDVVKRPSAFKVVFKALDAGSTGKITKSTLMHALRKDIQIAKLLKLPPSPGEPRPDPDDEEAIMMLSFEKELEKMDIGDDDEIHEAEFVSMAGHGVFQRTAKTIVKANLPLITMQDKVSVAEAHQKNAEKAAGSTEKLALKEEEEARVASKLASREETEAVLAEQSANKEEQEAIVARIQADKEAEEAVLAEERASAEAVEAEAAKLEAEREQEEARLALERANAEKADVVAAELVQSKCAARLKALQQKLKGKDGAELQAEIVTAKAENKKAVEKLAKENAEYDEARRIADKEAAEALEAAENAVREMAEAAEAQDTAARERAEATAARETAERERAEAQAAKEIAERERKEADEASTLARKEVKEAEDARENAERERAEAEAARKESESLRLEEIRMREEMAGDHARELATATGKSKQQIALLQQELAAALSGAQTPSGMILSRKPRRSSSTYSFNASTGEDGEDGGFSGHEEEIGIVDASTPWPNDLPHFNMETGKLIVTIVGCNNVVMADKSGTSDPYCLLGVGPEASFSKLQVPKHPTKIGDGGLAQAKPGSWMRTEAVREELSPVFNANFSIPLSDICKDIMSVKPVCTAEDFLMKIHLHDWDRIGSNDFLGEVTLGLFRAGVMDWTPGVETTITRGFVDLSSKVPIGHVKRRVDEHIGEARGAQGHLRQGGNARLEAVSKDLSVGRVAVANVYGKVTLKVKYVEGDGEGDP